MSEHLKDAVAAYKKARDQAHLLFCWKGELTARRYAASLQAHVDRIRQARHDGLSGEGLTPDVETRFRAMALGAEKAIKALTGS